MKKDFSVFSLVIALGLLGAIAMSTSGCASLTRVWDTVTGVSVSPTQIIVAANTFDGLEATATQYLIYCKANVGTPQCALSIRKNVVAGVRAGRTARNQLEPYVTSGTAGPAAIYNTLVASITTLQAQVPAVQGAK